MKLIADMAALDRRAITEAGIPGLLLMEEAGRQVAQAVAQRLTRAGGGLIVILCGPGNNGGDGVCCARKLVSLFGVDCGRIRAFLSRPASDYRADVAEQIRLLAPYGVALTYADSPETLASAFDNAALAVDALFGSGLNRPIEGREAAWLEALDRRQSRPGPALEVIAVDMPSGVEGASGRILGAAPRATLTVALGAAKPGHFLPPGKFRRGDLVIAPIGLPRALIDADPSPFWLTSAAMTRATLPALKPDAHKYSRGSVLVVGGSPQTPGAAILAARAALAAGAGAVTLAMPQSALRHADAPAEIIRAPLPETSQGACGPDALPAILDALKARACRALLFGPGVGLSDETAALLQGLLTRLKEADSLPAVVLDADALTLLAQRPMGELLGPHVFLTPHVGECARLLNVSTAQVLDDLPGSARALHERTGAHALLKASVMAASGPDGYLWINETGNPGMATAGSGDALAGLLTSLLAQGAPPDRAAPAAAWLHGASADAAARARGLRAVTASEMIRQLPETLRVLETPEAVAGGEA